MLNVKSSGIYQIGDLANNAIDTNYAIKLKIEH